MPYKSRQEKDTVLRDDVEDEIRMRRSFDNPQRMIEKL
jgi:hypothetical protein